MNTSPSRIWSSSIGADVVVVLSGNGMDGAIGADVVVVVLSGNGMDGAAVESTVLAAPKVGSISYSR